MKNASLKALKSFEISKSMSKKINGGTEEDLHNCIMTVHESGNYWLLPDCYEKLGDVY